ncbi:MAG: glycoside hydrolase family 3 C-terminal domain-containing protein [Bacteroidetes bacterium]|nr:glycoside hydrolase family 3 C-terminal domain-containing protein [Bacteroidota bacterium]
MLFVKSSVLVILSLFSFTFFTSEKPVEQTENPQKKDLPVLTDNSEWVKTKLSEMTLREKIAQMIVTNSFGLKLEKSDKEYKRLQDLVVNKKVGGVIFFKGNSIEEAELINDLQSQAQTPLLISADFERGTKMRLDDGSLFPSNMGIGATRNPELAYKMGLQIAKECKAMGIHQNYSPVMDVNNNPLNPIINVRSFGEDPQLVSTMGDAMIKGLQDGNIIATAKHFPGHGDTDIDSHNDLPVINYGRDRLETTELVPFKNAISSGVMSVMIAHLAFPEIEKDVTVPASLSKSVVDGVLINQLGFNGLIVTDALNMQGITKHFSTEQVALMCVNAGIDLILMPQGEELTISTIENAVNSGTISVERIDRSVTKILNAKKWLKLFDNKLVDVSKVSQVVNNSDAQNLSQQIADESITLVKNDNKTLPFSIKAMIEKVMVVSMNNGNDKANSDFFMSEFIPKSKNYFGSVTAYDLMGDFSYGDSIINYAVSNNFETIIIPVYAKVKIMTGTVGLPQSQLDLINGLVAKGKKVIVISFGNPYLIQGFTGINSYVCAYGDSESSIRAGIKAILGEINFKGKLPVTITDKYKFGTGLN